jgi:hypothetical protein
MDGREIPARPYFYQEGVTNMDFSQMVASYASIVFTFAWKVIVIVLATWGITVTSKRVFMAEIPSRIKALIPIVLGVLWMVVLPKEYTTIPEKIGYGLFLGVLSTSAYELILDKVLKFFEGIIDKITGAQPPQP